MKRIVFTIALIAATLISHAQLSWKIKLGNKTILQTSGENEPSNKVRVKMSDLSNSKNLVISYHRPSNDNDWNRNLIIDDSTNAGLIIDPPKLKRGSTEASFTITGKQLKELLKKNRVIKFQYTSIPSDPKQAMLVRVRVIHICTIYL
jgi:hypothetical protein